MEAIEGGLVQHESSYGSCYSRIAGQAVRGILTCCFHQHELTSRYLCYQTTHQLWYRGKTSIYPQPSIRPVPDGIYLTLLVLSMRTAYEGGATLLSTETNVLAALFPSFSRYHSLQDMSFVQSQCL